MNNNKYLINIKIKEDLINLDYYFDNNDKNSSVLFKTDSNSISYNKINDFIEINDHGIYVFEIRIYNLSIFFDNICNYSIPLNKENDIYLILDKKIKIKNIEKIDLDEYKLKIFYI